MIMEPGSILITGAAGFIGRYIAREFAHLGCKVTGLDLYLPSPDFLEGWNFSVFEPVDLVQQDLTGLLLRTRPAVLVHAAGSASVPASMNAPLADFMSSAVVLFRVLDALRCCAPDCRLIFLSSAAVYGNPRHLPVTENDPCSPISPYGFHKVLCEKIMQEFQSIYGLKVCSARIFSAYGEGLRRQVLWDICQKALRGPVVELLGTGNETRDFIHVTDIARAIVALAKNARFEAEAYNLASGVEVSIRELANLLIEALDRDCDLHFDGVIREGDPLRWRADVSRLHSLEYLPAVTIEHGAVSYCQWVKDTWQNLT
jgi:UDP-glucose 4-epimerase